MSLSSAATRRFADAPTLSPEVPGRLVPATMGALPGALPGRGLDPIAASSAASGPMHRGTAPASEHAHLVSGLIGGLPFQRSSLEPPAPTSSPEPPPRLEQLGIAPPPRVELRNIDQAAVPAHRSDAASSDVERSGQADSSSASPKAEASSSPWQREVALPSMPSPAYVPTAPEPERREPSRAPSPKNASNALPLVIAAVVVGGAIVAAAVFLKDELASLRRDRPKDDSAVRIGLGSDAATPAAAEPVAPTPTTSASASATTPRPLTAPPKPVANPGSTSPASQPNSAPTAKPAPAPTGAKFVPDGL